MQEPMRVSSINPLQHGYQIHSRNVVKIVVTTVALMSITRLTIKLAQKMTKKSITPFKGNPRATIAYSAASVTYLAVSVAVMPPLKPRSGEQEALNVPANSRMRHYTIAAQMEYLQDKWDSSLSNYKTLTFDKERFKEQLNFFKENFPYNTANDTFGFIEKQDVSAESKIFVRADLHGDLKSLYENLITLQTEEYLDKDFKCRPEFHMVFIGDYTDRGEYSCQILELLCALKMENPDAVTLIRGNHEDSLINHGYGDADVNFKEFLKTKSNRDLLDDVYKRMPLTLYLAKTSNEKKEYIQFTHGLFEPSFDPAQLLDAGEKTVDIPKNTTTLSDRVQQLRTTDGKLQESALRIQQIVNQQRRENDMTAYNWGDVEESTQLESLGGRKWHLTPEDIKHYMRISSTVHKVKLIFRGHQHRFQHYTFNGKVITTTLPVGMDSLGYKRGFSAQQDRAYILSPADKIKDWQKQALLRRSGESQTTLSEQYVIRSEEI